jgi:plasmid stabilization system protein ParE
VRLEWSALAMADLDRFAQFLHQQGSRIAGIVAGEIARKAETLIQQPLLGRAIAGREEYRQIVLRVLNADYVFQYRVDGDRIVVLRVFHAREARDSP